MKKIIILLFSLLFALTFVACKSDKQKPIGTDVQYYANAGQIPEIEYKIGADIDKIIKKYEENREKIANGDPYSDDDSEENDEYLGTFENGKNSCIATSGVNFYFDCDNRSAGVNRILTFNGAFGFQNGALINEVTSAMESYGHTAKPREPETDEISAYGLSDGTKCLEYVFENSTVAFFFEDSSLCATELIKK